jgi:hypothetical protein
VSEPALAPERFIRSLAASRDTLGRPRVKLIDVVEQVRDLTQDAPYAVIGGLAQILWARKSHTDDLYVALSSPVLFDAFERVRSGQAGRGWSLPKAPDNAHEADDVFEVYPLLYQDSVVDLIAFRDETLNREILASAQPILELGGIRFIRPELLLVCHLLRPGPTGALAAVELVIARRPASAFDLEEVRRWAARVGRGERLERVIQQAAAFDVI